MSAYRVVCNDAPRHLQWIVMRDEAPGRPIMVGGPYTDERVAQLHCDAMNREHVTPRKSLKHIVIEEYLRFYDLVLAGWHRAEAPTRVQ